MVTPSFSDLATPAQRQRFVDLFAARIAGDKLLGPAFGVPRHITLREYAWWEQALTGRCYQGRLLGEIPGQPPCGTYFVRWCAQLESIFKNHFYGPHAAEARGYVLNVATMLAHWQLVRGLRSAAAARPVPVSQSVSKSRLAA